MLIKSKFYYDTQISDKYCLVVGVGGVSMSSIALVLADMGYKVKGYDQSHGPYTDLVEKHGIEVCYGDTVPSLDDVSLITYTAAIKEDNPIMMLAKKKNIPCIIRADFLGKLMLCYQNRIGVSGTHGKSTTSGMIAQIFLSANTDPTVMIGANLEGINSGLKIGGQNSFIFEACEYKDSFLSFAPTISVVLNVELDHTDYFLSLDQMKASYTKFMQKSDIAVLCADSQNTLDAARAFNGRRITYSVKNEDADVYAKNITLCSGKSEFDVYINKRLFTHIRLNVPGEFQVSNALAAVSAAFACGLDSESIKAGLESFSGVGRRFQFRKSYNGAEIYDDYAHHPDEIKVTLKTAKDISKGRVIAVYQPHTYTRTNDLFSDFVTSFNDADLVIFADIYAAREKNTCGISSKNLADALPHGIYIDSFEKISSYLKENLKQNDLLVIMGAGDIINLKI